MKQLKNWSCDFTVDTNTPLTVGQKFGVLCHGSTPLNEQIVPELEFKNESQEYSLVLVRHKFKSSQELFLSTTSWKVGTNSLKNIKLKLGEDFIELKGPTIKVDTSLVDQNTSMNLPPGPMLKSIPEVSWYVLGFALFVFIVWALKMYRESVKMDRGMLKLNSYKTSLSPFFEFQKQLRVMKKSLEKKSSNTELFQVGTELYKNLVVYVSFSVEKPLFVLLEIEVKKILKNKIQDTSLVKEYFYLVKEIKKQTLEFKKEAGSESDQYDLESLVEEANDFSQKLNRYLVGANRV